MTTPRPDKDTTRNPDGSACSGDGDPAPDEVAVRPPDDTTPGSVEDTVWDPAPLGDGGPGLVPGLFALHEPDEAGTAAPGPGIAGFRLIRHVATGGMGEVWEAVQPSLRRRIAIKRLRRDIADDRSRAQEAGVLARLFRREALATAQLQHPNIVPIHELGVDARGNPVLVMKLVRGRPWSQEITADAGMPRAEFFAKHLRILVDVAQAVAFAHSKGILHRDLKPSQVMIGEFGEVMVMDWGLAMPFRKSSEGTAPENAELRRLIGSVESPSGTPAFMAPEQTGPPPGNLGPWTDVFQLGGLLYHLLTGTPPHDAKDRTLALEQARLCAIPPPAKRAPGMMIPDELSAITMRAMAPDPLVRYAGAPEFIVAVEAYLSGAGKRRESEAIVQRVEEAFRKGDGAYSVLAEALVSLARAEGLWRGNPRVRPLINEVRESYVRLAITNSDLTLAEGQAAQIDDEAVRIRLLEEVAVGKERARRVASERGLAIAGALALLVLLILGTLQYTRVQLAARQAAEVAEVAANRQRDAAEKEQYFFGIRHADNSLREGRTERAFDTLLNGVPERLRSREWGIVMAKYCRDDMLLWKGGQQEDAYNVTFSPDGTRIATGHRGGTLILWDAGTGARTYSRKLGNRGLWEARFSPDGSRLVASFTDGYALVLDAASGDVLTTITGHLGSPPIMRGVAFSPDGRRLATTGTDGTVRVWDSDTGDELGSVDLGTYSYDVDYSPDGSLLAVSMVSRGQAALVDARTMQKVREFGGHEKSTYSIAFSPDGQRVATASLDQHIRVFSVASGEMLFTILHRDTFPNALAFSPDGTRIASGADDGGCRIWDAKDGQFLFTLRGGPETFSVAFSPDGTRVASASPAAVQIWTQGPSFSTARRVSAADVPSTAVVEQVRLTSMPSDRQTVWGRGEKVWMAGNGRTHMRSSGQWYAVDSFYSVFSPDGTQRIAIGYDTASAAVVDNATETTRVRLMDKSVYTATFSPSGRFAAIGTLTGEMILYDAATWAEKGRHQNPRNDRAVRSLCFSPDESRLLIGWLDGRLTIWDTAATTPTQNITAHPYMRPVGMVAFSPDGRQFVTASSDKTAKVWSADTGRQVCTMSGHDKFLTGAEFSPDGLTILTASGDGRVKLWEAGTGREILTAYSTGADRSILSANFSADGMRILVATTLGEMHIGEVFPWREKDYSGPPTADFEHRLELYKRRIRMDPGIDISAIDW